MNKWKKTGLAVTASAAVISTAHIINQMIFSSSVVKNLTNKETRSTYKWKFGNISYTISGEGSPILLIHDLKSSCSLVRGMWRQVSCWYRRICHRPAWMWSFR